MSITPGRSSNGMYEYTLENGLKVLLVPRPGLDVCTANVTYHVGSAMEGLGVTGSTHFLEHLQFKGSKLYQGSNSLWKLEQEGAYINATTYVDRTNFFEVLRSSSLKEAIEREADRMLEPLLTEESLKSEMSVVRNELERGANSPFALLHQEILGAAFLQHPYHHSTIGYRSDVENVGIDALRSFHDTFYIPSNASYTIVGSFEPGEVMEQIKTSFGTIPRGKPIPNMYAEEPAQMGQRRVVVSRPAKTSLMGIAFKAVNGLHRDAIVLEVIAKLLAPSPTSPTEHLKKSGVVHEVQPSWERMKDPFVFSLWVTTNVPSEEKLRDAEHAVMDLVTNFPAPTEDSLNLAKTSIKYSWKEQMESTKGTAMAINEAIARGDAFDVFNRFNVLDSVTVKDIKRVANETFQISKSTVGWFVPGDIQKLTPRSAYSTPKYEIAPAVDQLTVPPSSLLKLNDITISNQTSAYTSYDSAKTYIRVSLQTPSSTHNAYETMTRHMLSQLMTKGVMIKNTAFPEDKIHAFLEQNGIERNAASQPYGLNLTISTASNEPKVIGKMVALLKSELNTPQLEADTFKYLQRKLAAELGGEQGNVNHVADTLLSQAMFKDGGCNYVHTNTELRDALYDMTHQSVLDEHKKLVDSGFVKVSVLSPSQAVINACKKFTTSDTCKTLSHHVLLKEPSMPANIRFEIPGKSSCTVRWGHVIDKPSIATKLAIGCLGNSFAGRLMKEVRDKQGLTYGIYARQKRLYGAHVFDVTATFAPTNLQKGIDASEKVMKEWKKGVTPEEVEIQKHMLIGSQIVSWDNPAVISATVHSVLLQGKPVQTIDDFRDKVNAVTFEEVSDALEKNLHVDRFKRVVVGTFSK